MLQHVAWVMLSFKMQLHELCESDWLTRVAWVSWLTWVALSWLLPPVMDVSLMVPNNFSFIECFIALSTWKHFRHSSLVRGVGSSSPTTSWVSKAQRETSRHKVYPHNDPAEIQCSSLVDRLLVGSCQEASKVRRETSRHKVLIPTQRYSPGLA